MMCFKHTVFCFRQRKKERVVFYLFPLCICLLCACLWRLCFCLRLELVGSGHPHQPDGQRLRTLFLALWLASDCTGSFPGRLGSAVGVSVVTTALDGVSRSLKPSRSFKKSASFSSVFVSLLSALLAGWIVNAS